MRVPVKFISFSCFLFYVTVVQGQEVTCELKSTTFGGKRINPEGKTIFRAGESVEITCTERHWFGSKENIRSFTCGENGQWDYEPVCMEIRCEVPRDQHVSRPANSFSGDLKLGAKRTYSCSSGYDKMSAEATCTRDGWTPRPLCAVMCAAPNIPNAEIEGDQRTKYIINSRIQYKCRPGFEPEQPVEIICISRNEWRGIRQCTAKQNLCRDPSVENGLIHSHPSNEEEIFYTCNTGYKPFSGNWWDSVTCSKGSWSEEPRCIREEECGAFPSVHHGKLKQTLHDRGTAEVECDPGFKSTQRFITCVSGTWEKPVCEPEKCSHPGDTANGDFTLIEGSEFVFGATVLYTCKKGFEMTSRINQRTCRAQGWDNTLPICEAVTCPGIRTDGGVIATGNTEEGSYGDVIHFECVSNDKKIDGSSDIHCTETGEWSDSVPKCKDITCTRPDIQNGYVIEKMQEYQKDAILKYRCSPGFKPREGIPRCAKFGWTLNPDCDEVTCELKSTTFGVKRINPVGKTIFRAGESVEITCTEKHWFYGSKENIRSFTCGETGLWDYEPVCAEIRCEVPRDQHVSRPELYFSGDLKLGAKRTYYCMSGYDQMSAEATCTRDGWTPKPLCAGQ